MKLTHATAYHGRNLISNISNLYISYFYKWNVLNLSEVVGKKQFLFWKKNDLDWWIKI